MSITITYKTLVSVNLLHNYYLDSNDSSFYSLKPPDRINILDKAITEKRYLIMQHLALAPTAATAALFKGRRIICRQTDQGLLIAVPVQKEIVNDQVLYKPLISFGENDRLQFRITVKNPDFLSYTNIRLNPVMPAIYYFTNNDISSSKTHPALSVPTGSFVAKKVYEMGEAAVIDGVASQAVVRTNKATDGWTKFDDNNYVSEYDRILLPKEFIFVFDQEKITKAKFSLLKDKKPVKVLDVKNKDGISQVLCSFETADDNTGLPDGIYTLAITASNGYSREYTLYLNNELYRSGDWGIVDLSLYSDTPKFNIITNDGYLSGNAESPYPAFELRFLSRATYWKYYFQQKKPTGADSSWVDIPPPSGMQKVIISKQPFSLMENYRKENYDSSPLPNPTGLRLSRENDKICSEMMLTKIKL